MAGPAAVPLFCGGLVLFCGRAPPGEVMPTPGGKPRPILAFLRACRPDPAPRPAAEGAVVLGPWLAEVVYDPGVGTDGRSNDDVAAATVRPLDCQACRRGVGGVLLG